MVAKIDDEKTRKSSLLIAPIRTEMLYPEPLVVQFFDVLSDQEATAIQNLANRQLNRATIRDPVGFEKFNRKYTQKYLSNSYEFSNPN